jgi:hypothetical protein
MFIKFAVLKQIRESFIKSVSVQELYLKAAAELWGAVELWFQADFIQNHLVLNKLGVDHQNNDLSTMSVFDLLLRRTNVEVMLYFLYHSIDNINQAPQF